MGQVSRELALSVGESCPWSELDPGSWVSGDAAGSDEARDRDVCRPDDLGCWRGGSIESGDWWW